MPTSEIKMPGKIPWDMLSIEEQNLYQRLCRAMYRGAVFAEQALERDRAHQEVGCDTSSMGEDDVSFKPRHAALKAKSGAAHQAYVSLINRYPGHSS